MNKTDIYLFTPYFKANSDTRQNEFIFCLKKNIKCQHIAKIFLLIDDNHTPEVCDPKIEVININLRPTYLDWIEITEKNCHNKISILANTDIYFDDTLSNIHTALETKNSFIALSRYEKQGDQLVPHPNPQWSQDVWAYFNTNSNITNSMKKAFYFPLGVPRCDNKIAYLFAINGWHILNPNEQIKSIHVHESQERSYNKKTNLDIIGAVAYVYPSKSLIEPAKVEIDIWAKNTKAIKSVKLNQCLDLWSSKEEPTSPIKTIYLPKINLSTPYKDSKVFIKKGFLIYNHLERFKIYFYNKTLLLLDGLNLKKPFFLPTAVVYTSKIEKLPIDVIKFFIPPILDTNPIKIKEKPISKNDCHFWQYPCSTEKQAFDNHLNIEIGSNINEEGKIIHVYLGLPWATYIDRKVYPNIINSFLKPRLMGLKSLAEKNEYALSVHTVCQHIYWRKFTQIFQTLLVNNLHISHCEKNIKLSYNTLPFQTYSWPLIATNIENKSRSKGMVFGKKITEKSYLASFIGAHMPHYRSNIRLKILEFAKIDGGNDIFIDLGDTWHFNKVVYQEQVKNQSVSRNEQDEHNHSTQRYNKILSDSIFSLCPEGAGPNTLRVWESLAIGSIPVIIADNWEIPTIFDTNIKLIDCIIVLKSSECDKIFTILRGMKHSEIEKMQALGLNFYQKIRLNRTF